MIHWCILLVSSTIFILDLKKLTALLKVSIPYYLEVRKDSYAKNIFAPSGSCTANFELKLMGGIPTVFPNSGPKKPGVYIFSASAKISRFHDQNSWKDGFSCVVTFEWRIIGTG